MDLVRLLNVKKTMGGSTVLDSISLSVPKNRTTVIIDSDGAGKTTLLRIISGQYLPDSGRVLFMNDDRKGILTDSFYIRERLRTTGGYSVDAYCRCMGSGYSDFDEDKLHALLDQFGISRKADALLLGNELQVKVQLAMALSCNVSFIIADEPFTGIPKEEAGRIKGMLDRFVEDGGTVLITGCSEDIVTSEADNIIMLRDACGSGGTEEHGSDSPKLDKMTKEHMRQYFGYQPKRLALVPAVIMFAAIGCSTVIPNTATVCFALAFLTAVYYMLCFSIASGSDIDLISEGESRGSINRMRLLVTVTSWFLVTAMMSLVQYAAGMGAEIILVSTIPMFISLPLAFIIICIQMRYDPKIWILNIMLFFSMLICMFLFIFRENELFVFPMLQDIWMPFVILTALSAVLSIVIYGVASKQYSGKDLFMRTLMDPFL